MNKFEELKKEMIQSHDFKQAKTVLEKYQKVKQKEHLIQKDLD
jgi:hypothetical protein